MTSTEKFKQALGLINQLCELFPEDLTLLNKLLSIKQMINNRLNNTSLDQVLYFIHPQDIA